MSGSPFDFLESIRLPAAATSGSAKRNNDLFSQLVLANTPEDELTHAGTRAGRDSLSKGAPNGPEFQRIAALPRRDWQVEYAPQLDELVEQYTREFRFDGACAAAAAVGAGPRLRPMQAVALHELRTYGRIYVVAGIGLGKTIVSGLAPTLLGCGPDDTVYLPPAKLVAKTKNEISRLYVDGWRVCIPKHCYSAEEFSVASRADLLFNLKPRCIVLDEAHVWSNPKSGRAKRLQQYLTAAEEAGHKVNVIPLSGTPGDTTLKSQMHLLKWALGAENSPLPTDKTEAWIWCMCLDADTGFDVKTKRARRRPQPGKLVEFLQPGEAPALDAVRNGVGRRMEETPGCFFYRVEDIATKCRITDVMFNGHSKSLVDEFAAARSGSDELADGSVIDVPVLPAVLFGTLGLGYVRTIDPPPPDEWRDARKAYNALIREILEDESSGLHTPGQVALRFASGALQDPSGTVQRWREIESTFEVSRHVVWIDDSVVKFVAERALATPQIVWVSAPEFGRKLAKYSGMPFFANQGLSASGQSIADYRPGVDGAHSVVASIASCGTGFNLQTKWHRNLIVGCPSKSDTLCQLIGRTLRHGQTEACVEVEVLMASIENVLALHRARERAGVDRTLGRAAFNVLLDCHWDVAPLASYVQPGDPVWSSTRTRAVDEWEDECLE